MKMLKRILASCIALVLMLLFLLLCLSAHAELNTMSTESEIVTPVAAPIPSHSPVSTHGDSPVYEDHAVRVFCPDGFSKLSVLKQRASGLIRQGDYAHDGCLSNKEDTERLITGRCRRKDNGQLIYTEQEMQQILNRNGGLDGYMRTEAARFLANDDAFFAQTEHAMSEVFTLQLGETDWYGYDILFADGSVRTHLYLLQEGYMNEVWALSLTGGAEATHALLTVCVETV